MPSIITVCFWVKKFETSLDHPENSHCIWDQRHTFELERAENEAWQKEWQEGMSISHGTSAPWVPLPRKNREKIQKHLNAPNPWERHKTRMRRKKKRTWNNERDNQRWTPVEMAMKRKGGKKCEKKGNKPNKRVKMRPSDVMTSFAEATLKQIDEKQGQEMSNSCILFRYKMIYSAAQKKVLGSIKSHFKVIIKTF